MSTLNIYIKSVTKAGKILIEKILARGSAEGETSDITLSGLPELNISMAPLTIVDPSKVNYMFSSVERKNRLLWDATNSVDIKCRRIHEISTSSNSSAARTLTKISSMLDGILQSASLGTSISAVYNEPFSDMSGTDSDQTTAVINNGMLSLKSTEENVTAAEWSVMHDTPRGNITGFNSATGAFSAEYLAPSSGSSNDTYTVAMSCTFKSPMYIFSIDIASGPCDIDSILAYKDDGSQVEILSDIVRITEEGTKTIWANVTSPVKSVVIKYVKRHYTSTATQPINIPSVVSSAPFKVLEATYSEAIDSTMMQQGNTANVIASAVAVESNTITPLSGENISYTVNVSGVRFTGASKELDGRWTSKIIKANGDARYIHLNTTDEMPEGTNISWRVSVEGGPWIPIIPVNKRTVLYERLDFDPTGIAKLKYPADPGEAFDLSDLATGTTITTITDSVSGYITAVEVDKKQSNSVTISYTTPYSGIVNLQELGMSLARSRLVDATSNGELGEWFEGTENQRITLGNQPSGEILVFVRGRQAIQLTITDSLDNPDLSTTKVYFKLVGRTLLFNDDYQNVTVYYKYLQTALRLRADLTTTEAKKGNSPTVDSVFVGIRMETI